MDCYGHFCGYEDTVLHTLLQDSLDNPQALVAKPLVFRALQSIITDVGLIACDLLRLEYPIDQTQEDTVSLPSPKVATDAPPNVPQAQVNQSNNLSAPTLPTQDTTTELDDLFESLEQTFIQFTPLLDSHTPFIPLPDPTDLRAQKNLPSSGQKCFK